MSDSEQGTPVDRRQALQSIGAAGAVASGIGAAEAATEVSADVEPVVPEQRRADVRDPYADMDQARQELLEDADPVLEELSSAGLLPEASSEALNIGDLVVETAAYDDTESLRLHTAPDGDGDVMPVVDTKVEADSKRVWLSSSIANDVTAALVYDDETVHDLLVTDGDTVERPDLEKGEKECGDVCDDCGGFWDCTAEQKVTVNFSGGIFSACGCIDIDLSMFCCSTGCSGLIPCSD